jgi:hypothetical protein
MNLLKIENELIQLNETRKEAIKAHEDFMKQNTKEIAELSRKKGMAMKGIDLGMIRQAEALVYIRGLEYGEYNGRCIDEAIKDIALDTPKLSQQYFGVKNYDRWSHQECDCSYGMGPSHGSIVFAVGLRNPSKKLSEGQKESCLYYLTLLKDKEMRESMVIKKAN